MTKASLIILLALSSTACASLQQPRVRVLEGGDSAMTCGVVCVAPGRAATAGHCVGEHDAASAVVTLPDTSCGVVAVRDGVTAEHVTIEGWANGVKSGRASKVVDANWLGLLIVAGAGHRGESGGGIYAEDGALLGVTVETRDGLTYARRAVSL